MPRQHAVLIVPRCCSFDVVVLSWMYIYSLLCLLFAVLNFRGDLSIDAFFGGTRCEHIRHPHSGLPFFGRSPALHGPHVHNAP